MIEITDLRGMSCLINDDLIEHIETNPDTQIVLNNGRRFLVKESPRDIVDRVVEFRRRCMNPNTLLEPRAGSPATQES